MMIYQRQRPSDNERGNIDSRILVSAFSSYDNNALEVSLDQKQEDDSCKVEVIHKTVYTYIYASP